MSFLGLLCLLCALVAGLFLVLYGLQRRDLKSLEQLSRQLQRIAIGGRLPDLHIFNMSIVPRPKCTRLSLEEAYPTAVVTSFHCERPSSVVM